MPFLIGWAAKLVGQRFAPFLVYGSMILIAVLALLWWGHTKYRAGVRDTDQHWHDASNLLQAQSANSASNASVAAGQREVAHDQQVSDERNRIDAAEQNGASPLDALFGS